MVFVCLTQVHFRVFTDVCQSVTLVKLYLQLALPLSTYLKFELNVLIRSQLKKIGK